MRILLGIVVMIVGVLMVKHVEVVADALGPSAFAQKYFGGGGSDSFYKLLGFGVIILGMLITTGLFGEILLLLLVPLFRGFAPQ